MTWTKNQTHLYILLFTTPAPPPFPRTYILPRPVCLINTTSHSRKDGQTDGHTDRQT